MTTFRISKIVLLVVVSLITTCKTNQKMISDSSDSLPSKITSTDSISVIKNSGNQELNTKIDASVTDKSNLKDAKFEAKKALKVGAERSDIYSENLKDLKIALVVNQTSVVGQEHLADFLLKKGIFIQKIFAPEHGFRGNADAGEHVTNGKDTKTGLPLISLYGKHKKPKPSDLQDIDAVIFDIQDVGVRFYTYISTMHYVMEACAENGKKCIVFDRPNPNGHYIDGMILDRKYASFVGMHPIPIVHGLTVGELATMINGEGWLKDGKICDLEVVRCENYTHKMPYSLPIRPSPNLPNDRSIWLYPTLCLFEGTKVSIGRGTEFPFQVAGMPDFPDKTFSFKPESREGAKNPKYKGQICYGMDFRTTDNFKHPFSLQPLIEFYQKSPHKADFFKDYLTLLYGSEQLRKDIEAGKTEAEIRDSWQTDLEKYKKMRQKYLLYDE